MKRIYLASDISQAQLVLNMLEQQLIPAYIENSHQSGGLGELAVNYPEIWLKRDQDVLRANEIIKNFEAGKRATGRENICPNCKETNPGTFDWCWACQADLS